MAFADVGIHIEHFSCEVAEAQMVVTLRRIHRNLTGLEFFTLRVLNNFRIIHESDEMYTKLKVRIIASVNIE